VVHGSLCVEERGGMNSAHTLYLASLTVAAVAALISGIFMVKSVREGEGLLAWAFAVVFLVSSLLSALYFWRLVL
jgi:hypothetical protein